MPWLVYQPRHLTIFNKGINNKELSPVVIIPFCERCQTISLEFYMELHCQAQIENSNHGLEISFQKAATDMIQKKISPENTSTPETNGKPQSLINFQIDQYPELSNRELAEIIGCSLTTVCKYLLNGNVELPQS